MIFAKQGFKLEISGRLEISDYGKRLGRVPRSIELEIWDQTRGLIHASKNDLIENQFSQLIEAPLANFKQREATLHCFVLDQTDKKYKVYTKKFCIQ